MTQPIYGEQETLFRILIADGDPATRMLLCHQLRSADQDVVEVTNGAETIRALRGDPTIRMAFLDWHMLGEPGQRKLCAMASNIGLQTYIIIIARQREHNITAAALNAGAHDYIIKPWNREILLARVGVGRRLITMGDRLSLQTHALSAVSNAIMITDSEGRIQWINPAYTKLTGYRHAEILGKPSLTIQQSQHDENSFPNLWKTISSGRSWHGVTPNCRKNGDEYTEETTIAPVLRDGEITHYILIKQDITERQQLQTRLLHAQKLESIGQLAAGIAHEINTPIQYVGDNTRFVRDSIDDLLKLIDQYGMFLASAKEGRLSCEHIAALESTIVNLDIEFVKEEIPKAISQSLLGVDRVAEIVRAMKDFSYPGGKEKIPIDLNKAIKSTITVCRNRWKYVADMETDFQDGLPMAPCLVGEFNQVILNIVVNAADAIGDVVGDSSKGKGRIMISTRLNGEFAEIRVSDTGGGIPQEIQQKIFDPFFTTKKVGKGTGQGLAISHDVIVNKHGGTIDLEVEPGVGTTFIIRLPIAIDPSEQQKEAA